MTSSGRDAQDVAVESFEELMTSLLEKPEVEQGTGFGSMPGLRVRGKIFTMLCRGELVVKLPRSRVDQLVTAGTAARFDARRDGRVMKEWATLPVERRDEWEGLASEALDFVSASA